MFIEPVVAFFILTYMHRESIYIVKPFLFGRSKNILRPHAWHDMIIFFGSVAFLMKRVIVAVYSITSYVCMYNGNILLCMYIYQHFL